MELDAIDSKILRAVQANCLISADELSETCGASPSTVIRRLKRLRDTGVIREEVAILEPKAVGRPLQMFIGVRLWHDDEKVAAAFIRQMREHPAVMQFYFVTGSTDYIVLISARSMDDYNAFVQLLVENPRIHFTETNVVINALKVGLKVPIEK
jgi:Lrp/AsnC family transcriptional regulator, leucine-responsive regulatory protein